MNWLRRITGHTDSEESGSLNDVNEASIAMASTGVTFSEVVSGANKKSVRHNTWGNHKERDSDGLHLPSASDLLDDELSAAPSEPKVLSLDSLKALRADEEPVELDDFSAIDSGKEAAPISQADDFQSDQSQGIAISLGDLSLRPGGWLYGDLPVMVFGVDIKKCPDPSERQAFFYRVHLLDCCAELQNPAQQVLVSHDYQALQQQAAYGQFQLCHDCLEQTNYLDYSHRAHNERHEFLKYFSFPHYVMMNGSGYFTDRKLRFWPDNSPPQSPLQPIELAAHSGSRKCCRCDWGFAGEESYFLSHKQCEALGVPNNCCILCAQDESDTAVILPNGLAEYLYQKRYLQVQPPLNDWQTVRRHLDKSWHSLSYVLQRHNVPLPRLYAPLADGKLIAPMAWPDLNQAVVVDLANTTDIPGWQIWSRKDVMASFLN